MSSRRDRADEAMQAMLFDVKVEGLRAAYTRAKKILDDDGAPATAHAAIINAMFRAGGLGGSTTQELEREPHEMTPEELERARQVLLAELAARTGPGEVAEPLPELQNQGVFD